MSPEMFQYYDPNEKKKKKICFKIFGYCVPEKYRAERWKNERLYQMCTAVNSQKPES